MSGEFKTFRIDKEGNKDKSLIACAVQEALGGLCPDFLEDWLPPPSYSYSFDPQQHVFRRGKSAAIVWARLFSGTLTRTDFDMICLEADRLLSASKEEKFFLHVFIPREAKFPDEISPEAFMKKFPADRVKLRILSYVMLWSWDQKGIALQEIDLKHESAPSPVAEESREQRDKNSDYQFFRQARLNRDELSALMDLSLELKNNKFS